MPRQDAETSSDDRDLLALIAAKMPELIDMALSLGAEALAERLAAVEACAFKHLADDDVTTPDV